MWRLVLLAQPRTGSNLAQNLISNAPNALTAREIFNPVGVFGFARAGDALARLSGRLGCARITERDPQCIALAKERPEELVDILVDAARASGRDFVSFTVFPGQLSEEALGALLADRRTRPVLLTRSHLSRYVSLLTAKRYDVWKHRDTSDDSIAVDLDAFFRNVAESEAWYARLLDARPDARRLSYEGDLCQPPGAAFAQVRRAAPWLSPLPNNTQPRIHVNKQDRREDVFKRIVDGQEVRQELERLGRLELALSQPLPYPLAT